MKKDHTISSLPPFGLMSLNLRFGLAEDGENGWRHRKKAYPLLFESYPAEFYLFQEANDFQVAFLKRLLADYDFIGQRDPAPADWQNNVIFHHRKWRCIDRDHFYLSSTPNVPSKFDQSQWPRQCTIGTFQNGPHMLSAVNTHFDFETEVQSRSATLICHKIAALSPTWPIVLAGDFNTDTGSECYNIFTTGNEKFNNAFDTLGSGTFHGFSGKAQGTAIDWVLYRGELKVHSAQVIDQCFNGHYPSDHFPLMVRFN